MQARKLSVMREEEYPEHGSDREKEVTEHAGKDARLIACSITHLY